MQNDVDDADGVDIDPGCLKRSSLGAIHFFALKTFRAILPHFPSPISSYLGEYWTGGGGDPIKRTNQHSERILDQFLPLIPGSSSMIKDFRDSCGAFRQMGSIFQDSSWIGLLKDPRDSFWDSIRILFNNVAKDPGNWLATNRLK